MSKHGLHYFAVVVSGLAACIASPSTTNCPVSGSEAGRTVLVSACLNCHSSALSGAQRSNAPVGVDFDNDADVRRWKDRILVRAVDQGTMPPAAPLDRCEGVVLREYVETAATGACTPSCAGRQCGGDGCAGSCGTC